MGAGESVLLGVEVTVVATEVSGEQGSNKTAISGIYAPKVRET